MTRDEEAIRRIGRDLHRRAASAGRPAIFEPRDWLRRMIERSLDDEGLRTALFRFVDVLPSLGSAREIGDHLEEYFASADHALGGLTVLAGALHAGWLVAPVVQRNVTALARRFLVEEDEAELFAALENLRDESAGFTLDVVGEAVVSEGEAEATCRRYERLLDSLTARSRAWPEVAVLDRGPAGPLPRVHLSVKMSSLAARFDPLDGESEIVAGERLRRLLREAARLGAAITVDMEQRTLRESTLAVFRGVLEEPEFAEQPHVSIALQAYLRDGERDLVELVDWAKRRRRRIGVRLVKGAYWDSEIAWAALAGWPIPVFTDKGETDAAFESMGARLLEAWPDVEAAFGSHNLRSLAFAIATAERLALPRGAYEIQMLYGMAEPLRRALALRGERVRVYVPVGDLLPGMAYLIRRLLENTSNVSFLRQSYAEGADLEHLLAPPRTTPALAETALQGFVHAPLTDFSRESERGAMARAIDAVAAEIDGETTIGARSLRLSGAELESVDPADPGRVVGRVEAALPSDVDEAVGRAAEGFAAWRDRDVAERAAIVREAGRRIAERRLELAAWIVREVGKSWRDADAEVAETIDYAEFYAREMTMIGRGRPTEILPGERNELVYDPLGVVAVISPWNFPLAITAGMTLAALVAGNAVVLKPAEQSPVIAAHLHQILLDAGVAEDACVFLPGEGAVGATLVRHPGVRAIAFTGSRAVGLEILRETAGVTAADGGFKRVVCEMGGKNPIVIDTDADRDEAIVAVLESAFGYQGQKCSAASRLIVVGEGAEPFFRRLADAARSFRVGPPADPRHAIGPLIERAAAERLRAAIAEGRRDGRTLLEVETPDDGWFIGPAIFTDLSPDHRLAREELFGPLLCAFTVDSFEEALVLANRSEYGLTAGVFSRSPAHLELARRELRAGNVYLNRGTTGAVVHRQPFGGLKSSGAGWKAGGPDYLKQFLESRTISENALRHGFSPDAA